MRASDLLSDGFFGNSGSFGYAVIELSLNEGLVINNLQADRTRHAYTTSRNGVQYGQPTGTRITNSVANQSRGAGFDTHPSGSNITFMNCVSLGSLSHGFQSRAVEDSFIGCVARDCSAAGMNINQNADRVYIADFMAVKCASGIEDDGTESIVNGAYLDSITGIAFEVQANANEGQYRHLSIRDAGTSVAAFDAATNGPAKFTLEDSRIEDTAGNNAYGVRATATTITDARLVNLDIRGMSTSPYNIGANVNASVLSGTGRYHSDSIGRRSSVTIATGVININNSLTPFLEVNGEGGSADNLVTITSNAEEGARINLSRGDANITVEHGTGNIFLNGSANQTLTNGLDNITLVLHNTSWVEVGRGIL